MKRSQDIEVTRMALEIQSLQSRLAFYMEKSEKSVSREEYEAKEAENVALQRALVTQQAVHEHVMGDLQAKHAAELSAMQDKLNEYQEAQALLQTENVDLKTLIEFWRRHQFGASSETMTDMMDKVVGKLPTVKTAMLADILSMVDRLNRSDEVVPQLRSDSTGNVKERRDVQPRKATSGRNLKKMKCIDVREVLPADFSDLPPNYKVIMRKGQPDTWEIEVLFLEKPKTWSKKYVMARCNIPGEDPATSRYPRLLFGGVPLDPTFASFVLEMKYGYNIPESRILEMLGKAGCRIPQATLNRWMHAVIEGLQAVLMPEIEKTIRNTRFTHNDETRILVCSQADDESSPSYKTEYIHGLLSPEANLFMMLYEKGSRGHQVQKRIFEDSNIMAFLADRCPMYGTLVSTLGSAPPVRGACWIHFRRYLLHAYLQDNRLEPMVQLLARLFQAEKIISGIKDLTDTRRIRERGLMCRPLVDAMFTFMGKVKEPGSDYGVLARRAASYLLDDREGFSAFLSCGLLEIGNNAVERCFRSIAKGRENWLQCGSHDAARHTAFMYSLVESCRMNDLDFGHYIETVLIRIQDGDTDFHGMLPNVIVLPETAGNVSVA